MSTTSIKEAIRSPSFIRDAIIVFCFNTTFFLFMLQSREQLRSKYADPLVAASMQRQNTETYDIVTTTFFMTLLKTIIVNCVVHFILKYLPVITRASIAPTVSKMNLRTEILPKDQQNQPEMEFEDAAVEAIEDIALNVLEADKTSNQDTPFYDINTPLLLYILGAFLTCALLNTLVGKILTYVRKSPVIDQKTVQVRSDVLFFINYGICVGATLLYMLVGVITRT